MPASGGSAPIPAIRELRRQKVIPREPAPQLNSDRRLCAGMTGAIVAAGERYGIETPLNRALPASDFAMSD